MEKERALDRYTTVGAQTEASRREQSRRVARQGMYYSGSFFLNRSPWIIIKFMEFAGMAVKPGWLVYAAFMLPLQGLFNASVYFRPRFVAKKEQYMKVRQNISASRV